MKRLALDCLIVKLLFEWFILDTGYTVWRRMQELSVAKLLIL
jgi:hypothetical protein